MTRNILTSVFLLAPVLISFYILAFKIPKARLSNKTNRGKNSDEWRGEWEGGEVEVEVGGGSDFAGFDYFDIGYNYSVCQ